jgi:hypothetical protein
MLQSLRDFFNNGTIITATGNKFVVWAINDKRQIRDFLNLIYKNPLLGLKPAIKLKVIKMIYAIDSKMSYNEYSMLENKSLNQ